MNRSLPQFLSMIKDLIMEKVASGRGRGLAGHSRQKDGQTG
jgi:hypothetical protein